MKYKNTPIHNSFAGAKQRCRYSKHASYADYGGRGILFEWQSFNDFLDDMGDSHFSGATLERVDNDGNYSSGNCIWASKLAQARNTRKNIHTIEDIREIRSRYVAGETQVSLARVFNDSQGNISNIITGRTWSEEKQYDS